MKLECYIRRKKSQTMTHSLVLLVALIATVRNGCDSRLTVRPKNMAVLYGTEAKLNCSTDSSHKLLWRIQEGRSEAPKTIYTGNKLAKDLLPFYRISSNKDGDIDLVISANEVTAKTYICEEPKESAASAELIALVSDPACIDWNEKNNVEAKDKLPLQLVCRVLYWGNWAPVMEWTRISIDDNGDEASASITEGVSRKSDNNSVEATLKVTRGQRANGTRYVCTTAFTESNRPKSVVKYAASNIPEYSHTWEYPPERKERTQISGHKDETVPVKTVVVIIVALVAIVSGLTLYIAYMKRKKTKDEHENLAMDAISSAPGRTFCEESDYVEIGSRAASVISDYRCSIAFYTGLDDQEMAKKNFYAALENKEKCASSTKKAP